MISIPRLSGILAMLIAVSPLCAIAQSDDAAELLARGEYVLRISGCIHCHTAEGGTPLAGGRPLETPFGTFYTPNITAHRDAGIGAWSEADFQRALRLGTAPDGSHYYPAFPYTAYTRMSDADIHALHAYILSLPASDQSSRNHDLSWMLRWRFAAQVWQWLFFSPGEFVMRPERDAQWNRGAYLAEALGHCGECHTPRNLFGALQADLAYAGTAEGPEGELVPNITPHQETGIGDWSRAELYEFLRFGELPNGEYTAGLMDPVITELSKLTEEDRHALTEYLRALPPIDNKVSN